MELRHLRSFLVTAEEGSVTRAAARLYIAQPALSRQLQDLERHVGRRLLTRHTRGIRLTEAGRRLLDEARTIVAAADRLAELAAADADDATDTLTLGFLDEGAAELNPPIVAAMRAAHPSARIVTRAVAWGSHIDQLRTGILDAVIGPALAFDSDSLSITPLYTDGRLAVLPATSRLAAADAVMVYDLLELTPLSPSGLPQAALDHFLLSETRGDQRPREDLAHPFVMADGLAAIASDSSFITVTTATERFFRHPGVVFRLVPDAPPTETVIATPTNRSKSALAESLLALAPAVARSLIGLVPGATAVPEEPAPRRGAATT